MSDNTIQTEGPADPNAKWRQYLYVGASALLKILGLVVLTGAIKQGQADAVSQIVQGILILTGSVPADLAAVKTSKQRSNGTFEPAPVAPSLGDAFQAVDEFKQHVDDTVAEAKAKVSEGIAVIQGAAALIPGGQAIASAVMSGPVGDLIQAVTDNQAARP